MVVQSHDPLKLSAVVGTSVAPTGLDPGILGLMETVRWQLRDGLVVLFVCLQRGVLSCVGLVS